MALSAEQQKSYVAIIDSLLDKADLDTVSTKQIRNRLAESVGYDITDQKSAINALIKQRFDEYSTRLLHAEGKAEVEAAFPHNDVSNGVVHWSIEHSSPAKVKREAPYTAPAPKPAPPPTKRSAEESDLSELEDEVKPKKKKVKQSSAIDDDAAFAARLQDEENRLARPTRGGATRKRAAPGGGKNGSKKSKKKSSARVKDDDDSSNQSGSDEPKEKKGAFHKPYNLSQPLAEVVGEYQMSRPQVVKKIWEYVRARDLQDPSDKRQIRCDDALRAVFKSERVHMFTMNKILSQQLYAIDE